MIALLFAAVILPAAPSPAAVSAMVDRQGPAAVVQALDADGRWDAILARIGAGDRVWIGLAPKLAPGADASIAEGLSIALATGLPKAPAEVLGVLNASGAVSLTPAQVCSAPFIEDTSAHQHRYKAQALAALSQATSPGLANAVAVCRAQLLKVR